MTILSVSGVSLSYGADEILKNVTFAVNEGDRVGVIGKNGAGKTSLFRILEGKEAPSGGSFSLARGTRVACLGQNAAADGAGTVAEYMLGALPELPEAEARILALEKKLEEGRGEAEDASRLAEENERFTAAGGRQYRARCDSLLEKTGFSEAEKALPVSALSGGQKTRLALARILFAEPDLLLLDEPTNHLDLPTLAWLESYLASYKKTLLVVSHDRYFLDRVTTKTLVLSSGRAALYPGNYSKTELLRDEQRAFEEKRWKLQQKEIARIEAFIEQQRRFGRERNFITIASREKALARMEKYERPEGPGKGIRLAFTAAETGANEVLAVRDLAMSFDGKELFSAVDLTVRRGERIFLVGQNGTGKSTLMRILAGKLAPRRGSVILGAGVRPAYYDQENHGLHPENTVLEELAAVYPSKTERELRTLLGSFLFSGDEVKKQVATLSGGEKCRLALCKMMWSGANFLLLDEPTNHLDISAKEALEKALEDYEGTALIVSHDRYFIDRIATRIVELYPAETGGLFSCPLSAEEGYDTFLAAAERERERRRAAPEEGQAPSGGKADYLSRKEETARQRKEQKKREKRQARVAELEALLPALETELYSLPAEEYRKGAELQQKLSAAEEELLSLYGEQEQNG